MIRNIVLLRLKPNTPPEHMRAFEAALRKIPFQGLRALTMGYDIGLRDGNMTYAVIVDLADEDAYRAYDAHPEHNRIRRELLAPVAERIERCQYRL